MCVGKAGGEQAVLKWTMKQDNAYLIAQVMESLTWTPKNVFAEAIGRDQTVLKVRSNHAIFTNMFIQCKNALKPFMWGEQHMFLFLIRILAYHIYLFIFKVCNVLTKCLGGNYLNWRMFSLKQK